MTKNAFLFSWDCYGIESIIPITQYEEIDKHNTIQILKGKDPVPNPLNQIIRRLVMRARYNPQRSYEIYAVDCDSSLDEQFWKTQWQENPQFTAELIRERGHKIFSDYHPNRQVVIK